MSRVALVTGGTRGIGEAISKALKAAGYKVATNYGGNDAAAQKFKAATERRQASGLRARRRRSSHSGRKFIEGRAQRNRRRTSPHSA
jgi:NAD(P)-dependent dehydrogenase (short-subunit alcohol dehydrogenase family)